MAHVGKIVTQNIVSGSEITDGTVTGADLASDIAISTSGAITTTGAFTSKGIDDNASSEMLNLEQNANSTTSKMLMVGENNNINNWAFNGRSGIAIEGTSNAILSLGRSSTAGQSAYIYHDGTLAIVNQEATNINIGYNTGTAIAISSNRHISMPNQPAFRGKDVVAGVATNGTTGYDANYTHYKVNSIELNQGNCFDNTNGIFTVPTAGIYFCHVTFPRNSDNWVGVGLVKNTTLIRLMWFGENTRDSASWDVREIICLVSAVATDKLYFTYHNGYTTPAGNNNTDMNIFKVA